MKRAVRLAAFVAMGAVIGVSTSLVVTQRREIERLRAKADVRDQVCGLAKSAIYVDRSQLAASPAALDGVLARVNTLDLGVPYAWGDNAYFLGWCMAEPFPRDQWKRCREAKDVTCLQDVLRNVEGVID